MDTVKSSGSYSSQKTTLRAFLSAAFCLYRSHREHVPDIVRNVILGLRSLEALLSKQYAFTLRERDVLDVGAGQFLPQMCYFAQHNRVVGIDYDVIAQGANPVQYLRMLCCNGPRRTAKTLARKLLGIDRRYRAELIGQLHVASLPKLHVHRMDACKMTFADSSFDFVHSFSVLHHLAEPGTALAGIVRVLRPGGVAYASLHLYTSESGFLDPRLFTGRRGEVALWPHLRLDRVGELRPNAFLNKLRIHQWRELFEARMPGATVILKHSDRPGIEDDAKRLLAQGEFTGYDLEELVTHSVRIIWKKPVRRE